MEKVTNQTRYLLGNNIIEVLPYFLYEISIYKITKNTAGLLESKYYTSTKLLNIKKDVVCKKYKNYSVIRFITLLATPIDFIIENKLPVYELKKKKK